MWSTNYPFYEIIVRAGIIYIGLFLMFRLLGRKQLGEMSSFDFVLLLIVSEAVSGGLIGEEYSLSGGLISAASLLVISYGVDYLAFKSHKVEKFVDGEPQVIILNGKLNSKTLENEKITLGELEESIRSKGIRSIGQVRLAVLEANGKISVIKKE
ncbi:MAG: YetF domain-containing protein [Bdellovibrionota bacterium]